MRILYRILGVIVHTVALMFTISLLTSFTMLFMSPSTMLSAFLLIAIILYSFFSFWFTRQVIDRQRVVQHWLRDWIRVNGIVTLVFCIFLMLGILPLLINPQPFIEVVKSMGLDVAPKVLRTSLFLMLLYSVILFIHILWTFALMKKHQAFFERKEQDF